VTIETTAGKVLAERTNPRASLAGHDLDTKWDPLQRLQIWIDFSNISYSWSIRAVASDAGMIQRNTIYD